MSTEHVLQPFERLRADFGGASVEPSREPVVTERTSNGLRLVEVSRSGYDVDVVAVCDRHPRDLWFSDVLPIEDAHDVVCIRCVEEDRLRRRRVSILDSYGQNAWLRVLGK